jgi:hypothetical protein
MEPIMRKTNDAATSGHVREQSRELTEPELDTACGGWFSFHVTARTIDAVGKALATMAQKQ